MSNVLARTHAALASMATRWILLALTICAPVHAFAQDAIISITGGDGQTGHTGNLLSAPLTVGFSSSSYASSSEVYWSLEGDASFVVGGVDYGASYQTSASLPGNSIVQLRLGSQTGVVSVYVSCDYCSSNAHFLRICHRQ